MGQDRDDLVTRTTDNRPPDLVEQMRASETEALRAAALRAALRLARKEDEPTMTTETTPRACRNRETHDSPYYCLGYAASFLAGLRDDLAHGVAASTRINRLDEVLAVVTGARCACTE